MTNLLADLVPLVATAVVCGITLRLVPWLLLERTPHLGNERKLPRQLVVLFLALASIAALALSLPVSDSNRNQVLGLVGLIFSGMFAFSSTTMVANLTAGMMLRVTKPFRTRDFIHVDDHLGRVSERGLLDTEIQTEHRNLVAFPHTYLITHPGTTIRASGTIVSVSLSRLRRQSRHRGTPADRRRNRRRPERTVCANSRPRRLRRHLSDRRAAHRGYKPAHHPLQPQPTHPRHAASGRDRNRIAVHHAATPLA
ncbi:MAG: mechanosensitive ion channel [Candidatus Synoicihabitans palmerolidicus]|nr:mechanosensitive ion channel [Candidatus Synoicihabitans palmerolidicus]